MANRPCVPPTRVGAAALALPDLAHAHDPAGGLPIAPLIYLIWTLAIGVNVVLALALLRRLRRGSEDRLIERRNRRFLGLALVGLFLALALTWPANGCIRSRSACVRSGSRRCAR
jgi:hypothetical protein